MTILNSNKELVIEPQSSDREIWLFIDSRQFGGIESHILQLAKGLIFFGKSVRVVLLQRYINDQPILTKLQQQKIPFSDLELLAGRSSNPLLQLNIAVSLHRPALIHAHGYKASIVSRFVCCFPSAPAHFSTYHAGETPKGKVRLYDFIDRLTAPLSKGRFVVSSLIADKVYGSSKLLNNFVAIPTLCRRSTRNIAFVGRLSHEKAPDRFLKLAEKMPQESFHIYGKGPLEKELISQLPKNVKYHGHTQDMSKEWPDIDILVIPSRYEGLPLAALEAMVMGVPVLATKVGALPELIEQGNNGWIAESPSELEQYLHKWLTLSEPIKKEIRQHARLTVSKSYSAEAVIPAILHLYSQAHLNS